MEIPEDLKIFVPEIKNYPDEVIQAIYDVVYALYPDEEHKLLRYLFFWVSVN